MLYLSPTRLQLEAISKIPDDEPVTMLNLLKFSDSGEKYQNYMKAALPFFEKSGAEILHQGAVIQTFIGTETAEWGKMLLVKYARKSDFLQMVSAEGYPNELRTVALKDSRLFVCQRII